MAVTVQELSAALRITAGGGPPEPQISILKRILAATSEVIVKAAPDAPETVRDQAIVQMAAYLYDRPLSPGGTGYAAAFRNSGALSLVSRWISRRTGISPEAVQE